MHWAYEKVLTIKITSQEVSNVSYRNLNKLFTTLHLHFWTSSGYINKFEYIVFNIINFK